MQVALLTEPGEFEIVEREQPEPAADEVLVRMREVGICGSDVHYYEHGRIGDFIVEDPLVLGHESAGEVAGVGEAVTGIEAGDRVTLEPGVPCRRCEDCKRGEYHLCDHATYSANAPSSGGVAMNVTWPSDYVYKLPESVSVREGALCEPLSVGIHAARRGGISTGNSVLITGCGPIGLCNLETASAFGATDIIMSDVVGSKLDLAAERGADRTIDVSEESLGDAVGDYTGETGVDVVIEASGADPAIQSTLDAVRMGGTIVFVGLTMSEEVPLDVVDIINSEIDVHGSFRYANTYPAAIELLADDRVNLEGFVDFESSLSDVENAFHRAMEPETIKGMMTL
jgi:L-iditol 2-dehydrogenase